MARFLSILGYIILISQIASLCAEGCLKCNNNNRCLVCDATSLYANVNGTCVAQELEFCLLAFDLFRCAMCYEGYYLEVNNKCVSNPSGLNEIRHCEYYRSFTRCKQCRKNYYVVENGRACKRVTHIIHNCEVYRSADECEHCADSIVSNDRRSCLDFPTTEPECMFYSSETRCVECLDGYYLEPNYFVLNISSMYETLIRAFFDYQITYNSTFNFTQCQKISDITHCAYVNQNGTCNRCEDGYYLDIDTKTQCLQNPEEFKFEEEEVIKFCQTTFTTIETINNVRQEVTYCSKCYNKYYLTVDFKKCEPHDRDINHCQVYSQTVNGECLQCESTHYRKDEGDEKCVLRGLNKNCKTINPLSLACNECVDPTYIKYYNDQFCEKPILNCDKYETSQETLSCKQCARGYYYDSSKRICSTDVIFDAYCTHYNSNRKCEQCNKGYFLNSITEECEANDMEYQFFSDCQTYHKSEKNVCIDCANFYTLTNVERVCKMFVDNPNDLDSDFVENCDQFEITFEGTFKCIYPHNSDDEDDPFYFIDTTTNKPVENTTSITDCKIYEKFNEGTTNNKCNTCEDQFHGVLDFVIENICSATDHPVCKDGIGRSSSVGQDICYKPLDICGYLKQGSIETNTCPYCSDPLYSDNEDCINESHSCLERDDDGYCHSISNLECGKETIFKREVTYNIYLSIDKNFCIREQIYSPDKCYKVSNNVCLLCAQEHYPERYKVYELERDYVVSYASLFTDQTSPTFNCIVYNSIAEECDRCATNFGLISQTNKRCLICTGTNKVYDSTGLFCLDFVSSDFPDTCHRVVNVTDGDLTVQHCVECKPGFVYQFNYLEENIHPDTAHVFVNGEKTFMLRNRSNFILKGCYSPSLVFFNDPAYADQVDFCEWGILSGEIFLCVNCKFGYWGELEINQINQRYVQNCVEDPSCNNFRRLIIEDPNVARMVSCHVCTNSSFIPTVFLYPQQYAEVPTLIFAENPSAVQRPTQCFFRSTDVDSNCMIQMRVSGSELRDLTKDGSTFRDFICLACNPGYKPTFKTIGSLYPFKFVTNCELIANCAHSYTANKCEECEVYEKPSGETVSQSGYILSEDQQSCSLVPNDDMEYCNFKASNTICERCKDGYTLADKCVSIINPDCLYYSSNRCVQARLSMGVTSNMIVLRTFSEYKVPQPDCANTGLTLIPNCLFYNENKLCIICKDSYHIGNDGQLCYERNVANCKTYNDNTQKCIECEPGFDLIADECSEAIIPTPAVPLCLKYSNGICVTCESGYYPFKINLDVKTICVDIETYMTNLLCEEIDEEAAKENILSCKKCKRIADIVETVNNNSLTITRNDFMTENAYSSSITAAGKLSYTAILNSYPYIRASLIMQNNRQWCRKYGGVDNCDSHDDSTYDRTFECLECNNDHYLANKACQPRSSITNCIEYVIDANACARFLGDNDYAVDYSTFDQELVDNPPKDHVGSDSSKLGIEGCIEYYNETTCKYCDKSKYLYDNLCLTVETQVPDCEIYSRDGICLRCAEGFLLLQNKCLTKYAQNCDKFLTNTNCAQCTPEFPIRLPSGSCSKNQSVPYCDIFSHRDSCHYCEPSYQNDRGKCVTTNTFPANCERIGTNDTCQKCNDGYYVDTTGRNCKQNPNYDKNCKRFDTITRCVTCKFNHYFLNNACYPCKTDERACLFCNPYKPEECALCKPGHYMDNTFNCIRQTGFILNIVKIQAKHVQNIQNLEGIAREFRTSVMWIFLILTLYYLI